MIQKILSAVLVSCLAAGSLFADDAALVQLSNLLADQASAAHDAAMPPQCGPKPPKFKNWDLRGELKDIREIALELRDRAAKCKGHTLVGRLKVKRLVANLECCNFLVCNGAATGLEAFPAAYDAVRETIGKIVAEMCCSGCGGGNGGSKSVE